MNNLNSILIEGNLVKDPVLKVFPKGTKMCTFSLASNRFFRLNDELQKEVSFIEVETWANVADICMSTLKKGRGVRVVGRLKQDRWNDTDGNMKSKIKIIADQVEFKPIFNKDESKIELEVAEQT